MTTDLIFVVAGTRAEFEAYRRKKKDQYPELILTDFIYVAGIRSLLGCSNPKGVFIGSWRTRHDIEEILTTLTMQITDPNRVYTISNIRDLLVIGRP